MKRIETYRIGSYDTDARGYASPSAVMRYMRETALRQTDDTGPSRELLHKLGRAFSVTRFSIAVYAKISEGETVTVETFPTDERGQTFGRCSRMYEDDRIVAEMSSVWGIVDIGTGKLCKISESELPFGDEEPISLDMPSRISIPKDMPMRLVGEHTVKYSNTDSNSKFDGCGYPDLFSDYIPCVGKAYPVFMTVSVFNEVSFGETFKIYVGTRGDGEYFLRTVKRGGEISAEAFLIVDEEL